MKLSFFFLLLSHPTFAASWTTAGSNIYYNPRPNVITVNTVSYSAENGGESSPCGNYVQTQCNGKTACTYTGTDSNCGVPSNPAHKNFLFVNYSCGGISYSKQIEAGVAAKIACPGIGFVGVGTEAPEAKLDVKGEVKFGNSQVHCNFTNEGQQRYDSKTHEMEYCNGKTWTPYLTEASLKKLQTQVTNLNQEVKALLKMLPENVLGDCSINGYMTVTDIQTNPNLLLPTLTCISHR